MTNFPTSLDDDTTLPFVNDNITEIGGDAINAVRDAVLAIEQNIGIGAAGTTSSLAARLSVMLNPDGTPKASVITSLGLVTLPITQDQIAVFAQIPESKLHLDHRTQDLFNYIQNLSGDINNAIGWISTTGVKLEPHLFGAIYRHTLNQIDVSADPSQFLFNNLRALRNNAESYSLINDINSEFLAHQWADGSPFGTIHNIITNNGSSYPSNYGHTASGIFLNTTRFDNIPQTADDLQLFAEFIDSASIFLLGTRIQNLYTNGISRISRSSNLSIDGYGQGIIPNTSAIAYFKNVGTSGGPFDSIDNGDDIVEFKPSSGDMSSNAFDAKFALVRPGDILRINYGTIEVQFIVKEKKYIQSGPSKKYVVRIAGKNLMYSPNASARIDRPLVNNNKFGELSIAPANNQFSATPSLIINSPRGAQTVGVGFSPEEFDEKHYLLYLAFYPTGSPQDGYTILPGIDVTGNRGTTPGSYTLESIVQSTNDAMRKPGFNYRFSAFSYQGEFGICLSDPYNNASFSIISAAIASNGIVDVLATQLTLPNNVVDLLPAVGTVAPDPLGFGPFGGNVASPPFMLSYGSAEASQSPTKLFVSLRRNSYYVNGTERERLNIDVGQALDSYGDGYWVGNVISRSVTPGPNGRVSTTYRVPLDLSSSNLKIGKTIVVQPLSTGGLTDFGRFIIQNVSFSCSPTDFTDIQVYDSIHAKGFSPTTTDGYNQVAIYFGSDSVSFNSESSTDFSVVTPFKRHFEVYVDSNGNTFTHERGRINISGGTLSVNSVNLLTSSNLAKLNIVKISPKLRGYQFGSVNKITLNMISFNAGTGLFTGQLASYDGTTFTHFGPLTTGKKGEKVRFYDESNVDFIDIVFDLADSVSSIVSPQQIDFQLFPTLSLDAEIMLLGTCQVNDTSQFVNKIVDERQFGNISEKDLSSSALNFISLSDKLLHMNGVVRGFNISNITLGYISINGGNVLVDGKLNSVNNEVISVPRVSEILASTLYPINYALCVNSIGEFVMVALTDYDSVLATPNVLSRLVTFKNAVTGTIYTVDSVLFSDLINSRKDLTVLHIISSTVTGTGTGATIALTSRDVRRFINDQDSSIPPTLTNSNSQGNFKEFGTAINWIKFNNNFQDTLYVKGLNTIATDPILSGLELSVIGQSAGAGLTFSSAVTMSHVTFDNVNLIFNETATVSDIDFIGNIEVDTAITFNSTSNVTHCTFKNATVVFVGAATINHVKFIDCNVTFSTGSTLIDVIIDPSTLVVNGLLTTTNVRITDCNISCNIPKSFSLAGSKFVMERCAITYQGGTSGGYDTSNLVNADSAMIYSSIGASSLTDIIIRDNVFTTAMQDRHSFVSFELTDFSAILQNINISRNTFNSTAALDDTRAIISIISTLTASAGGGVYPKLPKLVNVSIENNLCNNNQLILLSTVRTAATAITGAMLATTNVRVVNNTCGTIGFITAGDFVSNFTNNSSTLVRDKQDQLVISGNSCKFISNLDHRGGYISFRSTANPADANNWVQVGTGAFSITNNSANWIQVGASSLTAPSDGGIISNNRLCPANPIYLSIYTDTIVSSLTPSNVAILLRREDATAGTTQSIISNNIVSQKPTVNSNGTTTTYYYDAGIVNFNNAQIINNTINGVINSASAPMISIWSTGIVSVRENNLNRQGLDTQAYILGQSGATNQVVIANNFFDSQFIDAGNTVTTTGVNIPATWSFHSNKNQTGMIYIPIWEGLPGNSVNVFTLPSTNTIISPNQGGLGALFEKGSGSNTLSFQQQYNMGAYLERGVTITEIKLGAWFATGACTTYNGSQLIELATLVQPNDLYMDIRNTYNTANDLVDQQFYVLSSAGQVTNLTNATQYLTYTAPTNSPLFMVGGTDQVNVSVAINITFDSAPAWELALSPIRVKFLY
jgi:hypothetical protein